MITATFAQLRQAERDYPGILKTLRQIEANAIPVNTCGITGRTISLAALTSLFAIATARPSTTSPIV